MVPPEKRKHILHRRWAIAIIIVAILITIFHKWKEIAASGALLILEVGIPVLLLYLLFKLIDWLTGADLDKNDHRPYSDENQHSDVEDTMWDIYTTDQINKNLQHHDDFNDK